MLKNDLIEIRQWRESDKENLVLHANNINVAERLDKTFPFPYTISDAEVWIQLSQKDSPLQKLAIVYNNQACGAISIGFEVGYPGVNLPPNSAVMGYWLGETFWNKGLITQSVGLFIPYVFSQFNVNSILAYADENNAASNQVLRNNGFKLSTLVINRIHRFTNKKINLLTYKLSKVEV